jgi:hypothetical protein
MIQNPKAVHIEPGARYAAIMREGASLARCGKRFHSSSVTNGIRGCMSFRDLWVERNQQLKIEPLYERQEGAWKRWKGNVLVKAQPKTRAG